MGHSPENWTKEGDAFQIKQKLKLEFFLDYCYISDVMFLEK